jgi:pilus assembly protein Flp/PilA
MKFVWRLIHEEDGPTAVEYAVMLACILIVCIASITLVGGGSFNFWNHNRTQLESAFGS